MQRKVITFILFGLFLMWGIGQMEAQTQGGDPVGFGQTNGNKGNKPKAPSRQQIEAWYLNGYLTISFLYSEGECEMTVLDLSDQYSYVYSLDSSISTIIYIGEVSNVEITITTEYGNEYTGYIGL